MPTLAKVTFTNKNGMAVDSVVNTLVFNKDATVVADQDTVFNAVAGFFDGNNAVSGYNVIAFLGQVLNVTTPLVELYDLTGHLDGSPHGSPTASAAPSWAVVGTIGNAQSAGNQLSAVLGYNAAYDVAEKGGTVSVPTPESAVDSGAPATHQGVAKLRARERGRIFLGPLNESGIGHDTNNNPILSSTALSTFGAAASALKATSAGWSVWSRRDQLLRPVTHGFVDHGVKSQRGREFVPHLKDSWS